MFTDTTIRLAGTGHRPPRLGLDYSPESNRRLTEFVRAQLEKLQGVTEVICGMAQGFDMALGHAALLLSLPLVAAIPFAGQETRWPKESQKRYHAILARAKEVVTVSPGPYQNWKYIVRDKYMVDRSNLVLTLLDNKPERSGTRTTVEYAIEQGKQVVNCFESWAALATVYNQVTSPLLGEARHAKEI